MRWFTIHPFDIVEPMIGRIPLRLSRAMWERGGAARGRVYRERRARDLPKRPIFRTFRLLTAASAYLEA
jgi:hypothetical protein